ncbi:MAG: helix-turn-helix domain-containing protein [Acidobacteriaceae bacterium]|nr:helix-turn-helix domain-containing protein [Acidobacteriaceae bacterium]MBV8524132.1 helix-turn-helix domain-containing protein [Acetobacteraceae bacterium]
MILELHRQGVSVSAIARQVGLDRKTVRKYIERGLEPPIYGRRPRRASKLAPFSRYFARAACCVSTADRATSALRAARTRLHWRLQHSRTSGRSSRRPSRYASRSCRGRQGVLADI